MPQNTIKCVIRTKSKMAALRITDFHISSELWYYLT